MAEFVTQLPRYPVGIDRPVADETGLKDAYDFQFDVGFVKPAGFDAGGAFIPAYAESGPSIFPLSQRSG
jgi:uncharacterized protein (TIGR03435 family)